MAASFGAEEERLAVGIDVVMSPSVITPATTYVNLTWYAYARASYRFNDPQLLTLSNSLSTTKNYTMVSENYEITTQLIGSWTQAIPISYSGTITRTLVAGISGTFNGGTPSHSRSIVIPKRPPQVPSAPLSADVELSGTSAIVTWDRPANYNAASNIWSNVQISRSVNGGAYVVYQTLAGTATSYTDTALASNTTYAYSVYAKNVTGFSASANAGTIQTSLPAPTSVTPAATSTVTKPNPTLGATLVAIAGGGLQKAQWQFSTSSSFNANIQTVTESDTDLRASGATTETPPPDLLSLVNGVWYIRARAISEDGMTGPYTNGLAFTVNTPVLVTPTTVTPVAGATSTTMTPTLGLTLIVDPAGRFQKGQWQLATDNLFTTSVRSVVESDISFRASGAGTKVVPVAQRINLGEGSTWYIRARSIGTDGSVSAWTSSTSFTLTTTAPPVPQNITPATGGAAQGTNTPILGALLGAPTESRLVKAEWQLATNAGFSANLRTVTEEDGDLRSSGVTTEVIPAASKLYQGTWYIRAREIDEYGQAGSWSAGTTFDVSHPPTAILKSPLTNSTIQYTTNTTFSWTFSDTSSGDEQTAYQIIIENNTTGAVLHDTGKVSSTVNSGAHPVPIGSKDVKLRWKIRLWDTDNVVGSYSGYRLFTVSDPPVITITLPAADEELTTGQPTINWTNDVSTTQTDRRVVIRRRSDGFVVHDSGLAHTTSLTYTTPVTVLENLVLYTVDVTVVDQFGMTSTESQDFSTAYQAPDVVTISVDETGYDDLGYVMVDWTTTTPDAFFVDWRVYRRPVLSTTWDLVKVISDPDLRYWKDWTVPSGDTYEYAVTQTGGRFGEILESPIAQTESRIIEGTHYWLLNPLDESDNLRLSSVTGDSFTDDYEESELVIIGRGRKKNHGTRLGYAGTMTVQLRDDVFGTARSKRIKLQILKNARTSYSMRTPFGDLFQVTLGILSFSRLPGVGTSEFLDVTIPYAEVF